MAEHETEHHDMTKAQHDVPQNVRLIVMVIATCALLVVTVLLIVQYFDMSVEEEMERKVFSQPSKPLLALHATEEQILSRYQWIDEKKGTLRIPVDRAMELTLRDWDKRPAGLVEFKDPTTAPPPAPGTAPAPAPGTAPAAPPAGTAPAPAPGTAPAPAGTAPAPAGTAPAPAGTAPAPAAPATAPGAKPTEATPQPATPPTPGATPTPTK